MDALEKRQGGRLQLATPYPGSKRGSGVAARIIAQMPPHRVYVELFAGSAAVFEAKKLAGRSYLVEVDEDQWFRLFQRHERAARFGCQCVKMDALAFLDCERSIRFKTTLIYADPPYLPSVVSRSYYGGRMHDEDYHRTLLGKLLASPCMVMISGYRSDLYDGLLVGWRRVDIPTSTRGGPRVECLWCNFPDPDVIHDVAAVGRTARERWRIKKKVRRWLAKLDAMQPRERQAVIAAIAAREEER